MKRPCENGYSGFKVYGEGEWKVHQHGWSKRRTWRKLHLAVDEATGEIVAAVASEAGVSDDEVLPDLVAQVHEARTWGGEHVAVKVQRPGVPRLFGADMRNQIGRASCRERV